MENENIVKDSYERIYNWHQKLGKNKKIGWSERTFTIGQIDKLWEFLNDNKETIIRDEKTALKIPHVRAYCDLIEEIPSKNMASLECIGFVFQLIRRGLMEWSCNVKDEYGNSFMELAKSGHEILSRIDPKYGHNFDWDKNCALGERFGSNWSRFYPEERIFECIDCGETKIVGNSTYNGKIIKRHVCLNCYDKNKDGASGWEVTYE
jgi:hypothetical protein